MLFVEYFWAVFIRLAETRGNISSLPADGYRQQTDIYLSMVSGPRNFITGLTAS